MSKTDKTNPYWVKATRREPGTRETHMHHGKWFNGVCEVLIDMPSNRRAKGAPYPSCDIETPYYSRYGSKLWRRSPRREVRKALGFETAIRTELRRLRRDWKLEPIREDIDSSWGAPRRRCQVRDPWHWD